MTRAKADEQAFPTPVDPYGLTKREYFAAMAMQGLLANLAGLRKEGFRDNDIEQFAVIRANALIDELGRYSS